MNKRSKILFITHYSALYGANRSLLTLIEHFHSKEDFEVKVMLPTNGTMVDRLKDQGIAVYTKRYYGPFLYLRAKLKHIIVPFLGLYNLLMFPSILLSVKRFNPDLIYSNTSAENLGVFLAKFLKVKHISHIREFMSLDHESYFVFGSNAKRRFIDWSNGIVFVSKAVSSYIKEDKIFRSLNTVIYNGLKLPLLKLAPKEPPNALKFGIVGLIDPAKGQLKAVQYLKDILEDYPDATLHVFGTGSGNYFNKVNEEVRRLELTNKVIFHGFVNDLEAIYSFDILLMFSRSEGFGRVTVEAMMRGIPVIGFDGGGTTELIEHGSTGYLFRDFISFKQSLSSLMVSHETFNNIRKRAYDGSAEVYIDVKYCASVEAFVNKVLSIDES